MDTGVYAMKTGAIYSENPREHWGPFNTSGGIVLDLGCGFNDADSRDKRWSSPYYFNEQGAKLIFGIDINHSDVQILKDEVRGIFITDYIQNIGHLQNYIDCLKVTHLKCDIEGGEVALFDINPKTINDVAVEVHTPEIKARFLNWINAWGFKIYADLHLNHAPYISVVFANR